MKQVFCGFNMLCRYYVELFTQLADKHKSMLKIFLPKMNFNCYPDILIVFWGYVLRHLHINKWLF